MRKNNENGIYVINQPKHVVTSIILMDSSYPLTNKVHEILFKLGEISDLIFVFSSKVFPVETSGINEEKFTTLYQGCAFIDVREQGLSSGLIRLLRYCQEIFDKHLGYTISMCSSLEESDILEDDTLENILKVQASNVIKPIFSSRRLQPEELYEFYKKDRGSKKKYNLTKLFLPSDLLSYYTEIEKEFLEENDCRYCTWKSESPIMYFKSGVVRAILDKCTSTEGEIFVNTFTDPDIRYLFTNLTKFYGIESINHDIGNLEIGKL